MWEFRQNREGGLLKSHFIWKLTWFLACQNRSEMLKHVVQLEGGDIWSIWSLKAHSGKKFQENGIKCKINPKNPHKHGISILGGRGPPTCEKFAHFPFFSFWRRPLAIGTFFLIWKWKVLEKPREHYFSTSVNSVCNCLYFRYGEYSRFNHFLNAWLVILRLKLRINWHGVQWPSTYYIYWVLKKNHMFR